MNTCTLSIIFLGLPILFIAGVMELGIKLEIIWENRDKVEKTKLRDFDFM